MFFYGQTHIFFLKPNKAMPPSPKKRKRKRKNELVDWPIDHGPIWIHELFFISPLNSSNNFIGSQAGGLFCDYLEIIHQKNYPQKGNIYVILSGVHCNKREIMELQ